MLKSIKVILMVLLLTACAPQVEPKIEQKPIVFIPPSGNTVSSPVVIPYVFINPLKIKHFTEDESDTTYTTVVVIDGLKNTTIQTKINTDIRNLIDKMKGYKDFTTLPPFRGIKAKITQGAKLQNLYIYSDVTYNSNNVLSVSVNAYITFTNTDLSTAYLTLTEGLNFDLTSGKKINLSDVFTNDAKIADLINTSLSSTFNKQNLTDEIGSFSGGISLVGSFKGIQADQPFYLSNQGLNLLFDYRNPNFETGFSTYSMTVPFSDFINNIGITQRFSSSSDIYTQPIIDRQFLTLGTSNTVQETSSIMVGSTEYKIAMRYSSDLSSSLLSKLTAMRDKIKIDLTEYVADHSVDYIKGDVYMDRSGPFTCLYSSMEANSPDEFKYTDEFRCYGKNDVAFNLKDYFKAGYDYQSVIEDEFQKAIDQGYLDSTLSTSELFDRLRIRITSIGFFITSMAYSASIKNDQYVVITPLFSAFGINNLTVFD